MHRLEIYVDGKGSVDRKAERCHLYIAIASTSTDQSEAFRHVHDAVTVLASKFRALATKTEDGRPHPSAAVTAFTVAPLSTMSAYQRDQNFRELKRLPKEYTVASSAEAIFRDLAKLADVSFELGNMPYVSISDVQWRLTNAVRDEIEREARLMAIRDAVQKAQDYAGVLGRQVVAVEIKDHLSPSPDFTPRFTGYAQNMQQQQIMQQAVPSQSTAMAAITMEGPPLEPRTISVSAYVNAKFISRDGDADAMDVVG